MRQKWAVNCRMEKCATESGNGQWVRLYFSIVGYNNYNMDINKQINKVASDYNNNLIGSMKYWWWGGFPNLKTA